MDNTETIDDYNKNMGSIKTKLFVANIFGVVSVGVWIMLAVLSFMLFTFSFAFGSIFGVLFILFAFFWIPAYIVTKRIANMRAVAQKNDVLKLKELNSTAWAIVALIFAGVIPGIMLLLAHGPIDSLNTKWGLSDNTIDRLLKLKALMDSGVISKEDFEAQINNLLHNDSTEVTLKKLKSLLDSGAITQEEYDKQKQVVLSRMATK
ncbi:MAG: SHOCT domain-containing protein [Candidatus Micrarchaeaceae archaeon]